MNDIAADPHARRAPSFLAGGGEMGARMRSHDWAATPLGAPETWPSALRAVVSACLNAPMLGAVLWGPDLLFLYNDAYIPSLADRHPDALGRPVADVWGENWAQVAAPFHRAMVTGEGFAQQRVEIPVSRDGRRGSTWWDFSAAPFRGDDGTVAGLLHQGAEITRQVRSERASQAAADRQRILADVSDALLRTGDARAAMTTAVERLGRHLGAQRVVYGEVGDDGRTSVPQTGFAAGVAPLGDRVLPVAFDAPDAAAQRLGRRLACDDVDADPAQDAAAWAGVETRAFCAIPLVRDGRVVASFCVGFRAPHRWSAEELALIEDVALRGFVALERNRTETALRESEERLRLATEHADIGFWDVDLVHDQLVWPPRVKAMFGISPAVPVTMADFYAGLHPDDAPAVAAAFATAADPRRRGLYDVEYRAVGKEDAVVRWVAAKGRGLFDAGGVCVRVIGSAIDISARKSAEAALRASEELNRHILRASPDCVKVLGVDGRLEFMSEGGMCSMEIDDFTAVRGMYWPDVWPAADRSTAVAALTTALDGGTGRFQGVAPTFKGNPRWWDVIVAPMSGAGDRIERLLAISRDITASKRAEAEIRELNATLEARVEERTRERDRAWKNSRDLQLVIDLRGEFRAVNEAWTTLLGWSTAELVGRSFTDFVHPDDVPSSHEALAAASESALPVHENRYRHRDGSWRWISWVAAPEDALIYASGRDVTLDKLAQAELAAAQDALRQSQKMEAVGQLTGGIAHDFNNMLAVVIGSLDLLKRRAGALDARGQRHVEAAGDAARRAANLTQRLLAFSRQQPLRPEPIDANALVAGMSDLLRHSLGTAIGLETVLAGGLWRAHADPNQLENVILNLAVNARDAMPDGGRLTIETHNADLGSHDGVAQLGLAPGQYVLLAVTDTGSGMAEDIVAKAFDPFFTTKEVGKGTGLGLSQVYGFVRQSGGHVKLYSEPGFGTTVKIYLPRLVGVDAAALAVPAPAAPLGRGREVVLVVEDEAAVREFSVDALEELGYRVLEADGHRAALRLLDAHPEIALLFTDIVMPEVNGTRLASEARLRRPALKVLFTTGYTPDAVADDRAAGSGVDLLGKPFTVEELAAKLRAVLDGR